MRARFRSIRWRFGGREMHVLTIMLMLGAAAQTPVEPPLIPAFFTAQTLYDICTRPNHGQCSMYVAGVIDGVFLTDARTGDETIRTEERRVGNECVSPCRSRGWP